MKYSDVAYHGKQKLSPSWLALLVVMALLCIAGQIGITRSSFVDTETAGGNAFQAWASTLWTQTSQADFEAGIVSQVDTTSSPGDVVLDQSGPSVYYTSGNVTSVVLDTATAGEVWNVLSWDENLPANTDITLEVRASDTSFLKDAVEPAWIPAGGSFPVASGLPAGRYMQWRATLTTSDTSATPVLYEVRVYYYSP